MPGKTRTPVSLASTDETTQRPHPAPAGLNARSPGWNDRVTSVAAACVGIEHTVWSTDDVTITGAERSEVRGRPSVRPALRPPVALRVFIGMVAVGVGLFNVALMLSDRAPGITKQIFGDFAVRLSDRLNRSERIG